MKWLKYLPEHWQENVREYLKRTNPKYNELSASDFSHDIRLNFDDGSHAFFTYAFFIADERKSEVAVITEHCGYHIFPFCISNLETIDKCGNVVRTDSFLID